MFSPHFTTPKATKRGDCVQRVLLPPPLLLVMPMPKEFSCISSASVIHVFTVLTMKFTKDLLDKIVNTWLTDALLLMQLNSLGIGITRQAGWEVRSVSENGVFAASSRTGTGRAPSSHSGRTREDSWKVTGWTCSCLWSFRERRFCPRLTVFKMSCAKKVTVLRCGRKTGLHLIHLQMF